MFYYLLGAVGMAGHLMFLLLTCRCRYCRPFDVFITYLQGGYGRPFDVFITYLPLQVWQAI